ncbi:hypothetical protein AAMO2058_001706500 [Amorphochlora amoebiformis]
MEVGTMSGFTRRVLVLGLMGLALGQNRYQGTVRDFTSAFFTGKDPTGAAVSKKYQPDFEFTITGFEDWFLGNGSDVFNVMPSTIEFTTGGSFEQFGSNSTSFYPIDGLLYGNEGQSNNKFFTYTFETIVTITSTTTFEVWGSCSFWAGVCQSSCSVDIDYRLASSATGGIRGKQVSISAGTYRIWVAYAHNCQADPNLQIKLPLSSARCDATTAPVLEKGLYPLSGTNLNRRNILTTAEDSIFLMDVTQQDTSTSVWHTNKLDVRRGFVTTFDVSTSSNVPAPNSYSGFAFMVQNDLAQAQGDAGEKHKDGIAKGLAVEFEWTESSTTIISVETRYSTATGQAYTIQASDTCSDSRTEFSVQISYIPESSQQVWVSIDGCTDVLAIVSDDLLFDDWDTMAYVGFTAGVSGSDQLGINIKNWKLKYMQVTGTYTQIASAGVLWAQYGQHIGVNSATSSEFTRVTDVVRSTYVSNGFLTFTAGNSFEVYNPFDPTNFASQVEVVYFQNETAGFTRISTSTAHLVLTGLSTQLVWENFPTGTNKKLTVSSEAPTSPSYLLVPMDGCGNPPQTSQVLGFAAFAQLYSGTLFTTNSLTGISCSEGSIGIKYASYCGEDVTSSVSGTCTGQTSCTAAPVCVGGEFWEANVFSASWECYDRVTPTFSSTSDIAGTADQSTFRFQQTIYGLYLQQTSAKNHTTDIRFNSDSIKPFTAQFTFGDVSESTSTWVSVGAALTAGESYTIMIFARDAFSNNVTSPSTASSFSISFDQVASVFSATYAGSNMFNITFRLTSSVTNMQMFVRADSKDLPSSPFTITVNPAAPTQVSVTPAIQSIVSTQTEGYTAVCTLRDPFGNIVTSGHSFTLQAIVDTNIYNSSTFTNGRVLLRNITYPITGAYTVNYTLDGVLKATSTLNVDPGTESVLNYTLADSGSTYRVGGDANFVNVQTKDAFGNNRLTFVENPFKVEFDPVSMASNILVTCPGPSCTHQGQGQYKVFFTPQVSGVWSVKAVDGTATTNSSQAISVTVNAGSLSAQSSLEILNFTGIANETLLFKITAKDQFGNQRTHVTTDGTSFTTTIQHVSTGSFVSVSEVVSIQPGVYQLGWRTAFSGCAGTYLITVQISSTNVQNTTLRTVLINPAATAQISDLQGPGVAGGEAASMTYFTFRAYDAFDNLQLSSVSDTFSVVGIDDGASAGATVNDIGLRPRYYVNYTVIGFVSTSPEFTLKIFLNSSVPPVLVQSLQPITIPSDNDATGALSSLSLGLNTFDPDVPEEITITNALPTGEPQTTSRTFQLIFFEGTSATIANILIPTCTTAGSPDVNCNVTVNTASTKHLTTRGNYTMRIRVGSSSYSKNNYSIEVIAGTTDGPNSLTSLNSTSGQAGNSVAMFATVRDRYNNLYVLGNREVYFTVTQTTTTGQCNPSCRINATWDAANSRYVGLFVPEVATTFTIVARDGIVELGNTPPTLTVSAASASAANSSFSVTVASAGVYIAGFQLDALVILKDRFGNAVTGESSGGFSFTPSLQSNSELVYARSESTTAGTYNIQVFPNVSSLFFQNGTANELSYELKVNGLDAVNSPQYLELQPGNVDDAMSTVSTIPSTTNAGDSITLNVRLVDSFGNSWKQDTTLVRLTITTPTQSYSGPPTISNEATLGNGSYTFTFTITEANVFISYTLEYISPTGGNDFVGLNIPGLSDQTYILAIDAVAPQTIVTKATSTNLTSTAGTSPYLANDTLYTKIQLFDTYGNQRFTNSSGFGNVTVQYDGHRSNDYTIMPTAFICTSNQDYTANLGSFEVTGNFSTEVSCDSQFVCTIITRGAASGNYRMLIFVNGVGAVCYQFVINPNSASAANSKIVSIGLRGTGTTCTEIPIASRTAQSVGDRLCAVVQLVDAFGNLHTTNSTVQVSVGIPTSGMRYCANSVDDDSSFNVTSAEYTNNGQYLVDFISVVQGNFNVSALLGGVHVGAGSASDCEIIGFSHWYVYKFQPTVTPITVFAGVPNEIYISAEDFYGNNVTGGSHSYSLSLSHRGRAYSVQVSTSTSLSGLHRIDFLAEWGGTYSAIITLTASPEFSGASFPRFTGGNQIDFSYYINVTAIESVCTKTNSGNFRCSDDPSNSQCVFDYNSCGEVICTNPTPFNCRGTCVTNVTQCACTNPAETRCANGFCVFDSVECPENQIVCPTGFVNCQEIGSSFSQCAPTSNDCPSPQVCPPGTFLCDDGQSCASNSSFCFDTTPGVACASSKIRCHSGICADSVFDCPARTSCGGAGLVLCSDGSCRTNTTMCPSVYQCYDGEIRCPGGNCAKRLSDCPSQITCPKGYVLCENQKCAASVSECQPALNCSLSQVRCFDGSCAAQPDFCPTPVTCPSTKPIRCDDGSCTDSHLNCPLPNDLNQCHKAWGRDSIVTCPGGYCAESFDKCPTLPICPKSLPVRCSNGSCVLNSTSCDSFVRAACPSALPVTCPDGSCRFNISQCPSIHQCPSSLPVKCSDGSCVSARSSCETVETLLNCEAGLIRCPLIGCAPSLETCPSVMACPNINGTLYQRCLDGTCRPDCSSVSYSACSTTEVTCFPAYTGFPSCATNLTDCPSYYSCPPSRPSLCIDGTCAQTPDRCPPWTTSFGSKVPCSGGGWTLQQSQCGSPPTCPFYLPHKCQDESCRLEVSDCEDQNEACPAATPYHCPNGNCVDDVTTCSSLTQCTDTAFPVKCAAYNTTSSNNAFISNRCATSSWWCGTPFQDKTYSTTTTKCPYSGFICRDTQCVGSKSYCDDLSCPDFLPYVCESGLCASNSSACPVVNGCPFDRPFKCPMGLCVSQSSQCNSTTAACPGTKVRCEDGSCRTAGTCPNENGCSAGETRCLDGSCVTFDSTSSTNTINYCTIGFLLNDKLPNNACPFWRPYRCPGGLCANSKALCPQLTYVSKEAKKCPVKEIKLADGTFVNYRFPVLCADGSCVESEVQCPIKSPCANGAARCPDGSCRTSFDFCPTDQFCPPGLPVMCHNGACASSAALCVSPTSETGCPCKPGNVGPTGLCTDEMQKCPSMILGGLCVTDGVCSAFEPVYPRANGCNSSATIKCWNGECVNSAQDCKETNGCPASLPIRCNDGTCQVNATACSGRSPSSSDNSCADGALYNTAQAGSSSSCLTYSGCPVSTPQRCADGTCAKFRAFEPSQTLSESVQESLRSIILPLACPATLACTRDRPIRCADWTCQADVHDCPPTHQCPGSDNTFICPDLTCASSLAACNSTNSTCPLKSPILCSDGQCVNDLSDCGGDVITPTCAPGEVLCFDGSCLQSALDCISFQYLVNNPTQTAFNRLAINADEGVCPSQSGILMSVCPDGSCVPKSLRNALCDPVPACPLSKPHRCPDTGLCVANSQSCGAAPTCDENANPALTLCSDGTCRTTCLPTDGCQGLTPYFCPLQYTSSSSCVEDSTACVAATAISNLHVSNEAVTVDPNKLHVYAEASSGNAPPACTAYCNRDVTVATQTIYVKQGKASDVDVAVSPIDNSVRASLHIPGGAITDPDGNAWLSIDGVSTSELRAGINYLHSSVQFSGLDNGQMTFEQTVLSPAFTCRASTEPFNGFVTFSAFVDNWDLISVNDICLAGLFPSSDSWVCLYEYSSNRPNFPVVNVSESRFQGIARQSFWRCLDPETSEPIIYAFAHIPLMKSTSDGDGTNIFLVAIIIVISLVFGGTIVLLVAWFTQRASRYRKKMKEVQQKLRVVEDQIMDEKMYKGGLGQAGKDEEITMHANPLVVKFKSLQEQLREYKKTTGYYEEEAKKQKKEIEALEDQRGQLEQTVTKLRQQLEEQRHRILAQKKIREAQTVMAEAISPANTSHVAETQPEEYDEPPNYEDDDDDDDNENDMGRAEV